MCVPVGFFLNLSIILDTATLLPVLHWFHTVFAFSLTARNLVLQKHEIRERDVARYVEMMRCPKMLRTTVPLKSEMYPVVPEFTVGPRVPQHTVGNQSSVSHPFPSGSVDVPLPWATHCCAAHHPGPTALRDGSLDLVTPDNLHVSGFLSICSQPQCLEDVFLYPLISATSELKTGSNFIVICCFAYLYWSLFNQKGGRLSGLM